MHLIALCAAVSALVAGAQASPASPATPATPAFAFTPPACAPALQSQLSAACGQAPGLLAPTAGSRAARSLRTLVTMAADVEEDTRLLGSRRLAAMGSVIKRGVDEDESKKLLFSRRLARATSIMLRTPRDKKRMLGSKRLREARMILFNKASQTKPAADEETTLLGSKRLHLVRKVLVRGATEMKASVDSAKSTLSKEAAVSMETESASVEAVAQDVSVDVPAQAPTEETPKTSTSINYCGQVPTAKQVETIAAIRSYVAKMSDQDKSQCSQWIAELDDVDIYRYVLGFGDADSAFEKIKATAMWRKAENIDSILSEDMGNIFEEGKEEMIYLPPDKKGRPVLLYRSALHKPGAIDPEVYTRYVIQQNERAIAQYGLGRTAENCVLVDRIGSGLKNQDPALLRVLIPVLLNHYPYMTGAVYIAPSSGVFNVIWAVLKRLLTEDARKRFILINKSELTETLQGVMMEDALPKNLGGSLEVADWLARRRDLDKASAQLSQLDMLMSAQEAAANEGAAGGGAKLKGPLVWAGKEASEEELLIIGTIRVNVAELTAEEKSELGPWLTTNLENEDILRFIRRDQTAERTWEALKMTSKWRKEERIDDIADEEIDIMPEGGEEFYFTGMDNDGRPVLVYRACAHTPGRVDPDKYNRYVIKTLEYGVKKYGVGKTRQVAVVVDRVGSGLKNQDPALLRVLLPCFTTHFPGVVGNIYIAPVNSVFYAIWSLVSLLLDAETRESVKLLKKESKTEELLEVMAADVLPKNLGGARAVPEAGIL